MMTSYLLLAIPLFILAAEFMNAGSIMDRLVRFCNALVGRFRGGLALVNVVQSIIFASMSGSALADAAGAGKLMQSMMTREGKYTRGFAAALTAVSATIGPILPPSIPLVVYSLVSDASVGYLFLAGVVPGLLIGAVQMALIVAVGRRRNFPLEPSVPLREMPRITREAFPGAADADHPLRLPVQRHHHAHRGGGRGGRLRAADRRRCSTAASARAASTTPCPPARAPRCRSAC